MGDKRKNHIGTDDGRHVCVCCLKFKPTLKMRWGYVCSECLNPDWEPKSIYLECSCLAYEV